MLVFETELFCPSIKYLETSNLQILHGQSKINLIIKGI